MKEKNIVRVSRNPGDPLSPETMRQLKALENLPDSEIDTSDIPERTDWSGAVRGWENRPSKKQISIRLDADLIAYFKNTSDKYQSAINRVLREYVSRQK